MKIAYIVAILAGGLAAWRVSRIVESVENGSLDNAAETVAETADNIGQTLGDIVGTVKNNLFGTPYDDLIQSSAEMVGIEPRILYRLLWTESRFRPDIIEGRTRSPVGALGIAQFMPATAVEWCGSVEGALNPAIAIPAAARYLAWLRNRLGGDLDKAVAAYNWGVGNVQRKGLANAPRETVNYVQSITGSNIRAA